MKKTYSGSWKPKNLQKYKGDPKYNTLSDRYGNAMRLDT